MDKTKHILIRVAQSMLMAVIFFLTLRLVTAPDFSITGWRSLMPIVSLTGCLGFYILLYFELWEWFDE